MALLNANPAPTMMIECLRRLAGLTSRGFFRDQNRVGIKLSPQLMRSFG